MNEIEERFVRALYRITRHAFDPERPVIVTPFNGNYGLAGYVIAVNGSPPRGMVIAQYQYGRLGGITIINDGYGYAKRVVARHETAFYKNSIHRDLREATQALIEFNQLPSRPIAELLNKDPRMKMVYIEDGVVHFKGSGGYEIEVERVTTYTEIVEWVHRLAGKQWVTAETIDEFIAKVCAHHGLPLYQEA